MIGEYCITVSIALCYEQAHDKCFRLQSMPSSRNYPDLFKVVYRPRIKRQHDHHKYTYGDYAVVRKYLLTDKPKYADKNYIAEKHEYAVCE